MVEEGLFVNPKSHHEQYFDKTLLIYGKRDYNYLDYNYYLITNKLFVEL